MQTFKGQRGEIKFNDEDRDVWLVAPQERIPQIGWFLEELTAVPVSIRRAIEANGVQRHTKVIAGQERAATEVARAHSDGQLLMNIFSFTTGRDQRVCRQAINKILISNPLGQSMLKDLEPHGLLNFIGEYDNENNTKYTTNMLRMILAGFCMSISGVDTVRQVPPDCIEAWIKLFKDGNTTRWQANIWNSAREFSYRCLREIVFAYGRLTENSSIGRIVTQKRSDSNQVHYTDDLLRNPKPHLEPWVKLFIESRRNRPVVTANYLQMFRFLAKWLDSNFEPELVKNVPAFLATPNRLPTFVDYVIALRSSDGEYIPSITHHESFQCAKRFQTFIVEELSNQGTIGRVIPIVDEKELLKFRNTLKRNGKGQRQAEAKARPLPLRLRTMVQSILQEGEEGWPGQLSLCREVVVGRDGRNHEVYCPVLPTLFLAMLELPVRMGQLRRLDSGEGDLRRFDGHNLTWGPNEGPNAGYWKDRGYAEQRGYASEVSGEQPFTGFFINTNKTGSPWTVPWQNESLHRLLYNVRLWQEKYFPISRPIEPRDYVDQDNKAEEGSLDSYPDIFPLFRMPLERRSARNFSPPTYRRVNEFWQTLMQELERVVQLDSPDETIEPIVKINAKTGQAQSARYTIHGIRVAGITALFHQQVPTWVISKLIAGHASVMMTLYYLKMNSYEIHQTLQAAAVAKQTNETQDITNELKSLTFEQAKRRTATVTDDGLIAATSAGVTERQQWTETSVGLCVWGGERCSDGGEKLRSSSVAGERKDTYAPVEGGAKNCILCRHFITGPAWIGPLTLHGSKLLRQLRQQAQRVNDLQDALIELGDTKRAAQGSARKRVKAEIERVQSEIERLQADQEVAAKGVLNTEKLLKTCVALIETTADPKGKQNAARSLITHSNNSVVEYMEVSNFEQDALLTEAGRVYPLLHDPVVETSRNLIIDRLLWDAGIQPLSFAPVDKKVLSVSQDAFASFLLKRLEHTEFQALEQKSVTLIELGLLEDTKTTLTSTLGKPLELLSKPARQGPLAIAQEDPASLR